VTTARLRKLHPITVAVLILSAAAMVLIAVPGLLSLDSPQLAFPGVTERQTPLGTVSGGRPDFAREFEHGWPCTYMRRAVGYSVRGRHPLWPPLPGLTPGQMVLDAPFGGVSVAGYEVAWTAPISWPTAHSDVFEFYAGAAIVDALVAVAIVFAMTCSCEVWLRRRGSIFRWRIIDFIAVITVVAVALGYWKSASDAYRLDTQTMELLFGADQHYRILNWRYRGPEWLARLIGSRKALEEFDRVVDFRSDATDGSAASWRIIGKMTGLERLEIGTQYQPSEADFAELLKLPRLQTVSWGGISQEALGWLPRLPTLRRVVLWKCELPDVAIEQFREETPHVEIEVLEH
jgi:hypothetical protein